MTSFHGIHKEKEIKENWLEEKNLKLYEILLFCSTLFKNAHEIVQYNASTTIHFSRNSISILISVGYCLPQTKRQNIRLGTSTPLVGGDHTGVRVSSGKKKEAPKYLIRVQLYEILELNWAEEKNHVLSEIQLFQSAPFKTVHRIAQNDALATSTF